MNTYQLSRQLLSTKKNHTLRSIVRITLFGMQLAIVVMVMAFAVTEGYKRELQEKLAIVGTDIKVSTLEENYSFDAKPFNRNQPFVQSLNTNDDIVSYHCVATKVGVLKAETHVEGVVCQGIDKGFHFSKFEPILTEGKMISIADEKFSNEMVISDYLANLLELKVGDRAFVYFVQDPPKQRRFTVSGIYNTYLSDFDKTFIFLDLRQIQQLNGWDSTMVTAIDIYTKDPNVLEKVAAELHYDVGYDLKVETNEMLYPNVFAWINLFDTNVLVLLIITIVICIITMISTFFIIILEHIKTVGIFKTIGFTDRKVFQVFFVTALRLIGKGLLLGNLIAFILAGIQMQFHVIKLDPSIYYVEAVPLAFDVWQILALNAGVLLICLAALAIPAWLVAKKISPISAIRYE